MDHLEDMMRRSDPVGPLPQAVIDDCVAMAREATRPAAVRPPARRRTVRRAFAALAAAAVMVPATAFGAGYLARTGQHDTHPGTEGDRSEHIDVCAPDFAHYVRSLPAPSYAPPSGMTWSHIADVVAKAQARVCSGGSVYAYETGIKDSFNIYAGGVFVCRAVREHRAGADAAAAADARRFATALEQSAALGTQADEGWKPYRDAGLRGDWRLLAEYDTNGVRPCP